jgi:hypothetical protein
MNCVCCKKPRLELKPSKSPLIESMSLLMCETCLQAKHQPRHIVIIAARSKSTDYVRDYIVKVRYCGQKITAEEITL